MLWPTVYGDKTNERMILFYPQLFETINNSQPVLFQTFEQLRFPSCVLFVPTLILTIPRQTMESLREFLENSTIHGLCHISTSRSTGPHLSKMCIQYIICPTHLAHPIMVCHTYPQTGAGLAKLPGPSLSSPALSHTCKKIQILTRQKPL